MRIVYIANARIPSLTANSVQIMKMCAALAAAGHDVTLLLPRFDALLPDTETLARHYGVPIRFEIRWLRGWRTLGRLAFEKRATLHALRRRADLYFTRNERVGAVCARLGLPTVIELHQPPRKLLDRLGLRLAARARGLRALVVISHALRDITRAEFPALAAAAIVVEHDGVDLERFRDDVAPADARAALGWPDSRLTGGYAGHLYPGRGVELMLELARRFPDVAFKLIGGEADAVERVRTEVGARALHNVAVLGFVPNADLPHYLRACDVLLMPYGRRVQVSGGGETAAFASPMKMFEYMAARRPIIASSLPGVTEVLHEQNALLCEPDDVQAWAAALQRAHDAQLRAQLGARARADVEDYAWDRRVQRILAATAR